MVDDETWGKQYRAVRDTTRNLIESAVMGGWPRRAAIVDFGIDSEKHYEALAPSQERAEGARRGVGGWRQAHGAHAEVSE